MILRLFKTKNFVRIAYIMFCAIFITGLTSAEHAVKLDNFCLLIKKVDRAYFTGNKKGVENVLKIAAQNPSRKAAYIKAFINYRLAILSGNNHSEVRRHANQTIEILEQVLTDIRVGTIEEKALLSGAYGMKIAANFLAGIRLGPKSADLIKSALNTNPHNPRVLLLDGIRLLNTPTRFGGDHALAINRFRQALTQFSHDQTPFCWGESDAHYWLAKTLIEKGELTQSDVHVKELNRLQPGSPFVKSLQNIRKDTE